MEALVRIQRELDDLFNKPVLTDSDRQRMMALRDALTDLAA